MRQEERWMKRYEDVVGFLNANHRNPSKYDDNERGLYCNWIRHNRKLFAAGLLKEDRAEKFQTLVDLTEKYKRKNQYE